MFDLSSKTKVNRRFRLAELYKLMAADKDIKADAKGILSVVLMNVLSQDTMNVPVGDIVKEIYIFYIELSSKSIPALFISSLDKAINLHTLFVLRFNDERMLYGCYKEKTEKGVKLGKYYSTDWTKAQTPISLPLNVFSMDDIYTAIIDRLIPIAAKQNETTSDFVARYDMISKLKFEIDKKQRQVDNERQSKKRFEINDELKKLKEQLAILEN
ncbi:MAG: DUF4391 domain-containing protein [Clostridiales bacterium]|nr:DUF4391 domain-containing protein [Clostridiales bacterium]